MLKDLGPCIYSQVTANTYDLTTRSTIYKGIYLPWLDGQLNKQGKIFLSSFYITEKKISTLYSYKSHC